MGKLRGFGIIFGLGLSVLTTSPAAIAAETVILKYGQTQQNVAIADLETLAATGEFPQNLGNLAIVLSPEQKQQIANALQTQVEVDSVIIHNFLDTVMGRRLLGAIAALTPEEDIIQLFKLRRAITQSARNPGGLSLLGILAAYPDPQLEIDLENAFIVAQTFNQDFWRTQAFMARIAPQLAPNRPDLDLPFDPTQPGNATVRVQSLTLQDRERDRAIPVDLYTSTAINPEKPVIIFSHGLFSVNEEMRYLAQHLASHGYLVAVPEHPGSNGSYLEQFFQPQNALTALFDQVKILQPEEFLHRPQDLSFVLDYLETLNQTRNPLRGKIATDNILVLGYSLGGATALSLAGGTMQLDYLKEWCPQRETLASNLGLWAQCQAAGLPQNQYNLRDERVKGAIALSPVTSLLFGDTGLSSINIPTLIVAGSADKTTPALPEQIQAFQQLSQPKWLAGIIGGTHLSYKDPLTTTDQAGQPDTLYSGGEVVDEQAWEVRNYSRALTLAMAAQLTPERDRYRIFLTPEYAQFVSSDRLPLRLVRQLPDNLD
ncbi:MAG: alpha/beta hydrolase [Spirulinaceae cyanobacterium]